MDSKNVTPESFRSVCRTCLQSGDDLTSIFESSAAHMLAFCDLCVITQNDDCPSQICATCLHALQQCFEFKQLCDNSNKTLLQAILSKDDVEEPNGTFSFTIQNDITSLFDKVNEITEHQENSLANNELGSDTLTEKQLDVTFIENQYLLTVGQDSFIAFLEAPLPAPLQHCCEHCSCSFGDENDLKIHQSLHNNDLVCLGCMKKFSGRQILKRHLKIHLVKKPHICNVCNKSFAESYALTKHMQRHSGIRREKRHLCSECGQGFSEPYYLKLHVRKHTGERPLVCPECQKSFADPRSFKIHAMIHSGEKPYACNFCGKSFVQRANLTKHLRIHTGEKPYACKQCNKKFSQSSSLDKHYRTHTAKKK